MAKKVQGVGADAPVIENERGAKQSASPARLDLLPALATLRVGEVLKEGAEKYGEDNWRGLSVGDHLNHMLVHVYAHLAGDSQDDHLAHAACRAMMALETRLTGAWDA